MSLGDTTPFAATLVGVLVALAGLQWKIRRQLRRAAEEVDAGGEYRFYVAMRIMSQSRTWPGCRWRQGSIRGDGSSRSIFVPDRPRLAKRFDFTDVVIVGEELATVGDLWWFANDRVRLADTAPLGRIELGFGPGPWIELARRVIPVASVS